MKAGHGILAALLLLALGIGQAAARPPGLPGPGGPGGQLGPMGPAGQLGTDGPPGMERGMRHNRLHWIADRDEDGQPQRPQRLSPEERRELRRDVNDAGRDLYRPHRRMRRDAGRE